MDGTTREPFAPSAPHDAFPVGAGGSALTGDIDPDTGLPMWSATRLATLQCKLNQRLGPEYLSQRPGPGGGPKLTYIEGWRVVDLANEVFGFNGWSTSVTSLDIDYLDVHPESGRCNCGVSAIVRITLRDGTYHEDVGYGHTEGARGKHAALEKCKKEAITDSIKRGLKTFGRLLGNCLYDRQYAREVLRMPVPSTPFDASDLHRHGAPTPARADVRKRTNEDIDRDREATEAKQARLRLAAAARAKLAGRQAAPERRARPAAEPVRAPDAGPSAPSPPASARPQPRPRVKAERAPEPAASERAAAEPAHPSSAEAEDAEAASMALELELEDDLLLRQSQLAQELEDVDPSEWDTGTI